MFTQPATFFNDKVLSISLWRNLVLTDTAGDMIMAHVAQLERAYAEAARRSPDGFVVCSFIGDGVPAMTKDRRDEITRILRSHEATLRCVAMVIEQHGVGGQMLRTIVRGINALTRNNRILIFAKGEAALAEIAPFVDGYADEPKLTEELLSGIVARMRANYALLRRHGFGNLDVG